MRWTFELPSLPRHHALPCFLNRTKPSLTSISISSKPHQSCPPSQITTTSSPSTTRTQPLTRSKQPTGSFFSLPSWLLRCRHVSQSGSPSSEPTDVLTVTLHLCTPERSLSNVIQIDCRKEPLTPSGDQPLSAFNKLQMLAVPSSLARSGIRS